MIKVQTVPYLAYVWQITTQSISTDGAVRLINFDSIGADPYSLWNNTNKRFVVGTPGYYRLTANILVRYTNFQNSSAIFIRKNAAYVAPGMILDQSYTLSTSSSFDIVLSGTYIDYAASPTDFYDLCIVSNFQQTIPAGIGGTTYSGLQFQIEKIA